MAEEKSFLQQIKLEISRSFRLVPYERLSFHKILGILKSETGFSILLKELDRGQDIRFSAILTLVAFDRPEVQSSLIPYLKKGITDTEKIMILDHAVRNGTPENASHYIEVIEALKDSEEAAPVVAKAFDVLKALVGSSEEVLKYLMSVVSSGSKPAVVSLALEALAVSMSVSISMMEELLKKGVDDICYSIFRSIYILVNELIAKAYSMKTDEDRLFTYSPESEDKIVLEIRVLLGKMTTAFDGYSNKTKIAYICSMISCNHREYLIYTMKALTSNDDELVIMILYTLYANVHRLRDPDKLFRNLIALSTETTRYNELIVDIFVRYFTLPSNTRQFNLLKDKLFGYIIVTLETYFETYRKDFMITDVIEKGYPESYQRMRKFILEHCNPELKKEMAIFLTQEEPAVVKHLIDSMSKKIIHIRDEDKESLSLLIEAFLDSDRKSRENTATRIEDLNFEKLYLRNRIIRLCNIIGQLGITDAATIMVNIYNYLKKYPDREIIEATIHTLSILNYSYMLGEIEVLLTTGGEDDQQEALNLISLFSEQRSLNILLEFLKNRIGDETHIMESALGIILEREIAGNITANQIFKAIIEKNKNHAIRSLGVLGIGKCGFETDIDYLNNLFYAMSDGEPKDVIVRAIADIISLGGEYNKRQLVRFLQEYLKDPGIKVRIYSCLLLAQLGSKEAIRSIRDMLIIKNKAIQRDILTILRDLRSIEFSFFLLSLLKEEYGISRDIIPVIENLSEEEMKEIDGFIVNIFRKFEAPDLEGVSTAASGAHEITINGLRNEEVSLLNIQILDSSGKGGDKPIPDVIDLSLRIKTLILSEITKEGGIITRMSNENIIAYFTDPVVAAAVSLIILKNIRKFNNSRYKDKYIGLYIQLINDNVKIINDEIIELPPGMMAAVGNLPLKNRAVISARMLSRLGDAYSYSKIPEMIMSNSCLTREYFELQMPVNFTLVAESIMQSIHQEKENREKMELQLEEELKKLKKERRSTSSITMARELEDISQRLQDQLMEIENYVQKRSTDRELIKTVRKMLNNTHNLFKVELSRIIID